jgi:hypothetical protein
MDPVARAAPEVIIVVTEQEVTTVQGKVGDRIVVESERTGQADRAGEILAVTEHPEGVDYRVRWDDGRVSELRPKAGSARIVPAADKAEART